MTIIHNLGFPRIGVKRELKKAQEAYWAGKTEQSDLLNIGKELRHRHWQHQVDAGLDLLTVGDFAWYDQILEFTSTIGAVPSRFAQDKNSPISLDTVFRMARGRAPHGEPAAACEMTKWFNTNYHYIVPELHLGQQFRVARDFLFEQVEEAKAFHLPIKVVLPGPLTYLWLSKGEDFSGTWDEKKLQLLPALLEVYQEILAKLAQQGVSWLQFDEPILGLTALDNHAQEVFPDAWRHAFEQAYAQLKQDHLAFILATYFEGISEQWAWLSQLPVKVIHVDFCHGKDRLEELVKGLPADKILSAGVINGRNIWRADLATLKNQLTPVVQELGERLWLAPSCSLLHVPVDLNAETELDDELRSWLSFALQKLGELKLLSLALSTTLNSEQQAAWDTQLAVLEQRKNSKRIHSPQVQEALKAAERINRHRPPFAQRQKAQQAYLNLPLFPTTTIGSFPQTDEIRAARRDWRQQKISDAAYQEAMRAEIAHVIKAQEELDIDVLVHGEAERNDMVEYFGELLSGYAFTQNGWVQSYGSRCVKPPIIYGDVNRIMPMTVYWAEYAQSLTQRPVKGMLTGPVTILQWSFVRDDQPTAVTCRQIALAIREEVLDLEAAGISIIQIDEPAFREGLPLRQSQWQGWLAQAVDAFLLTTSGVKDTTQIHTHMCYSEFNDIIEAIAALDADVITIETSRSNMELLKAFEAFSYPNEIGPGVYDIHSPNVPTTEWMVELLRKAAKLIPAKHLWVNPDCGLKTRAWPETQAALAKMVAAAKTLRKEYTE